MIKVLNHYCETQAMNLFLPLYLVFSVLPQKCSGITVKTLERVSAVSLRHLQIKQKGVSGRKGRKGGKKGSPLSLWVAYRQDLVPTCRSISLIL